MPGHLYLRATPIFVDGVLYSPNGVGLAEAFDPATGETLWIQQPFPRTIEEARGRSSRGMDYWADGSDRRLVHVRGGHLHALDPETGRALAGFGDGGRVDLVPASARRFSWSSGPIVVNDVIVVAGVLDGAGDSPGSSGLGCPAPRRRQPARGARHEDAPVHGRRRPGGLRGRPGEHVGQELPRLRQSDRRSGLGDRVGRGYDGRPHVLHARREAVHRRGHRRRGASAGVRRAGLP